LFEAKGKEKEKGTPGFRLLWDIGLSSLCFLTQRDGCFRIRARLHLSTIVDCCIFSIKPLPEVASASHDFGLSGFHPISPMSGSREHSFARFPEIALARADLSCCVIGSVPQRSKCDLTDPARLAHRLLATSRRHWSLSRVLGVSSEALLLPFPRVISSFAMPRPLQVPPR
jgi:hypothetical protein